jgi:hypothetical protein
MFHDEPSIEALSMIELEIASVGNHARQAHCALELKPTPIGRALSERLARP